MVKCLLKVFLPVFLFATIAVADDTPSRYALPLQLRPISQLTVVRTENISSYYQDNFTNLTLLTLGYSLHPTLGVGMRLPMIYAEKGGDSVTQFGNPAGWLIYTPYPNDTFRVSFLLRAALPLGAGSGDNPSPIVKHANSIAMLSRFSMENMLFLPNDFTVLNGITAAYVKGDLTLQVDSAIINNFKWLDSTGDNTRTNSTIGFAAGYYVAESVSVHGEALYQHWLSTPKAVQEDESKRFNLSGLVGVRYHQKTESGWFRPAIAYGRGLVGPISNFSEIRVDFPISF